MLSFLWSFFKRTTVQFSPPVKGRITNYGKPLSGVEVVRELFYEGYDENNSITDYALTNTNGEFSFNEKIIKSRYPGHIFGENFPVSQKIYIKKNASERKDEGDKYYCIWRVSKHWESISILNDLMLRLDAELQNKQVKHVINTSDHNVRINHLIVSICYWEDSLIETYYNNELINSYEDIK